MDPRPSPSKLVHWAVERKITCPEVLHRTGCESNHSAQLQHWLLTSVATLSLIKSHRREKPGFGPDFRNQEPVDSSTGTHLAKGTIFCAACRYSTVRHVAVKAKPWQATQQWGMGLDCVDNLFQLVLESLRQKDFPNLLADELVHSIKHKLRVGWHPDNDTPRQRNAPVLHR